MEMALRLLMQFHESGMRMTRADLVVPVDMHRSDWNLMQPEDRRDHWSWIRVTQNMKKRQSWMMKDT
jgi:hypothetical protein